MALVKVTTQVVKVRDELPRIIKDYKWWDNGYVAVGWDAYSGKYPDGTLVAQVAVFNEFGSYNENGSLRTPARPFMRPAYQKNKAKLDELRRQVIEQVNEGKLTPEKGLNKLGYNFMQWVRSAILSNPGPALRPRTLAKKRREGKPAVTLIDTRRMLDTLTYKIYLGRFRPSAQMTEQAQNATSAARQLTGDTAAKQAARSKALRDKVMTARQIKREKETLREELRRAKRAAARQERVRMRRFRASVRRDVVRARADEKRQHKRFRASVRRDKKAASQAEKAQKRRFDRSRARDRKRATHVAKVARNKVRYMAKRDARQAKGLPRIERLTDKQKAAKLARAKLQAGNRARLRGQRQLEAREARAEKEAKQKQRSADKRARKKAQTAMRTAKDRAERGRKAVKKDVQRGVNALLTHLENYFK